MKDLTRHIINAGLAGVISLLSGLVATEHLTLKVLGVSFLSAGLVMCYKMKTYFDEQDDKMVKRYNKKGSLFNFV